MNEFEAKQKELDGIVNLFTMKVDQAAGGDGGMPEGGTPGGAECDIEVPPHPLHLPGWEPSARVPADLALVAVGCGQQRVGIGSAAGCLRRRL